MLCNRTFYLAVFIYLFIYFAQWLKLCTFHFSTLLICFLETLLWAPTKISSNKVQSGKSHVKKEKEKQPRRCSLNSTKLQLNPLKAKTLFSLSKNSQKHWAYMWLWCKALTQFHTRFICHCLYYERHSWFGRIIAANEPSTNEWSKNSSVNWNVPSMECEASSRGSSPESQEDESEAESSRWQSNV